jgi:hypothetical protein
MVFEFFLVISESPPSLLLLAASLHLLDEFQLLFVQRRQYLQQAHHFTKSISALIPVIFISNYLFLYQIIYFYIKLSIFISNYLFLYQIIYFYIKLSIFISNCLFFPSLELLS